MTPPRPRRSRGPAALLVGAALTLGAVAGCDDDEERSEPQGPTPQSEQQDAGGAGPATTQTETQPTGGVGPGNAEETTETAEETTEGEPSSPEETGGTGPAPADPSAPDSPTNDLPPEPGSPQEAFEQYCTENPGACG